MPWFQTFSAFHAKVSHLCTGRVQRTTFSKPWKVSWEFYSAAVGNRCVSTTIVHFAMPIKRRSRHSSDCSVHLLWTMPRVKAVLVDVVSCWCQIHLPFIFTGPPFTSTSASALLFFPHYSLKRGSWKSDRRAVAYSTPDDDTLRLMLLYHVDLRTNELLCDRVLHSSFQRNLTWFSCRVAQRKVFSD